MKYIITIDILDEPDIGDGKPCRYVQNIEGEGQAYRFGVDLSGMLKALEPRFTGLAAEAHKAIGEDLPGWPD